MQCKYPEYTLQNPQKNSAEEKHPRKRSSSIGNVENMYNDYMAIICGAARSCGKGNFEKIKKEEEKTCFVPWSCSAWKVATT